MANSLLEGPENRNEYGPCNPKIERLDDEGRPIKPKKEPFLVSVRKWSVVIYFVVIFIVGIIERYVYGSDHLLYIFKISWRSLIINVLIMCYFACSNRQYPRGLFTTLFFVMILLQLVPTLK